MKIAIIGYKGFLGHALSHALFENGHEVLGLAPRPDDSLPFVKYIQFDVTEPAPCIPNCDAVFYLAQSPYYRDFPSHCHHLFAVNGLGALTSAVAAHNAGVKHFFYASTGSVYVPSFLALQENSPVSRSQHAYIQSKLMAEDALRLLPNNFACALRIFGLYGPGQKGMLTANIIDSVKKGRKIFLEPHCGESPTSGLKISLLYVNDCAQILTQLAKICHTNETAPEVLNIAGPEAISIRHLSETVGSYFKRPPQFEVVDSQRAGDLWADISQLQKIVSPRFTPFKHALVTTCMASA